MPKLKYREVVEKVKEKPVFGVEDLVKQGVPQDYAKTLLYRMNKREEITRIERDKYTAFEDPMLVAPYLSKPSYLSLWTSLRFHNVTQQSPFTLEVVTSRPRYNQELEFKGSKIHFYKIKPEMMFGYSYEVYENKRVPLASPEKAVIDGIYLNAIPLEEVKGIIPDLDEEKLRSYAPRAGQTIEKRIERVLN